MQILHTFINMELGIIGRVGVESLLAKRRTGQVPWWLGWVAIWPKLILKRIGVEIEFRKLVG